MSAGGLNLVGITKRFGTAEVVKDVHLDIEPGELIVFVGPSGCGKSTLLRLIAGLETPSTGAIRIGERDVTGVEPAKRGIAMVFQSYALYPHMSVAQNMGFGLRIQGMPRARIRECVARAAQTLQLTELLDRKPRDLSGGQRQRVAIGRAIVRNPQVFLFDEPLSNLDAALRAQMRVEIARLHAQLGATMIYVTHDQVEAMTLASRIVVLNAGHVEQVGAPLALYRRPANLFVAGFLGAPRMNFLPGRIVARAAQAATLDVLGCSLRITLAGSESNESSPVGSAVTYGVRPEDLEIVTAAEGGQFRATVSLVERLGSESLVHMRLEGGGDLPFIAKVAGDVAVARGQPVAVKADLPRCHAFDAAGRRIGDGAGDARANLLAGSAMAGAS